MWFSLYGGTDEDQLVETGLPHHRIIKICYNIRLTREGELRKRTNKQLQPQPPHPEEKHAGQKSKIDC